MTPRLIAALLAALLVLVGCSSGDPVVQQDPPPTPTPEPEQAEAAPAEPAPPPPSPTATPTPTPAATATTTDDSGVMTQPTDVPTGTLQPATPDDLPAGACASVAEVAAAVAAIDDFEADTPPSVIEEAVGSLADAVEDLADTVGPGAGELSGVLLELAGNLEIAVAFLDEVGYRFDAFDESPAAVRTASDAVGTGVDRLLALTEEPCAEEVARPGVAGGDFCAAVTSLTTTFDMDDPEGPEETRAVLDQVVAIAEEIAATAPPAAAQVSTSVREFFVAFRDAIAAVNYDADAVPPETLDEIQSRYEDDLDAFEDVVLDACDIDL